MGKECMARLSRRLWGGTSVKTAAKEATRTVTSTITLLNTIYRQATESTGTLLHVLPTTLTTTNGSYWKAGLLT